MAHGRRRDILVAALDCFTRQGFAATTMEAIRRRARASTGSIYHHFASKEQLAAALYVEALRDYQAGVLRQLRPHGSARHAVRAIVAHHLRWVRTHRDWARYLFDMGRHAELVAATEHEVHAMNRDLATALRAWLAPHVAAAEIARLPDDVYIAVLIGPAQVYARAWLAGKATTEIGRAARLLADAAWQGVRAGRRRAEGRTP